MDTAKSKSYVNPAASALPRAASHLTDRGLVTADRMTVEAGRRVRRTVQEIVDELAVTHPGKHRDQIVEAIQVRWSERVGPAAPPLERRKAIEYAEHISRSLSVNIVPG
jgi:hypothetical protein